MKKFIITFMLAFILVGCNNAFTEHVETAEDAFTSGNFALALEHYELALEEKADDEEVLQKVGLLKSYFLLVDLMDEKDWEKALQVSEEITTNEAMTDSLQIEVDLLLAEIEINLENEEKISKKMKKFAKALKDEDVDNAEKSIKQLEKDFDMTDYADELAGMKKDLEKTKEVIAEKEKQRLEEEKKQAAAKKSQLKNDFKQRLQAIDEKFDKLNRESIPQHDEEVFLRESNRMEEHEALVNEIMDTLQEFMEESNYKQLKNEHASWTQATEQERHRIQSDPYNGTAATAEGFGYALEEAKKRSNHLLDTYF